VIIGLLERWSRQHQLTWCLHFAGEDVGTIVHGASDPRLANWLSDLRRESGARDDATDDRATALRAIRDGGG
jgi:hypothetical protein